MKKPSSKPAGPIAFVKQSEVDYRARRDFLVATTEVMKPAPIDILLENVLPAFRRWYESQRFDEALPPTGERISAVMAASLCRISEFDHSPAADDVRTSVARWCSLFQFSEYPWISDAGFCTLWVHLQGSAEARAWYLMPQWDKLHPEIPAVVVNRRGTESNREYLKRWLATVRLERKQFMKKVAFRTGARTWKRGWENPTMAAELTAMKFAGVPFAGIADRKNMDPSRVRKAILDFCGRAGLSLPSTASAASELSRGQAENGRRLGVKPKKIRQSSRGGVRHGEERRR